jgi:hypothetical protein
MCSCAPDVACMLRAGVQVVSEVVYREAFAWAFVIFELGEVRDGHPQVGSGRRSSPDAP